MNQTTTAGIDLDKLEALARAADELRETIQPFVSTGGQLVIGTFSMSREEVDVVARLYDALPPATVRQLINLARRAEPSVTEADERALFEAWLRRRWPNAQRPIDEKTDKGYYVFSENNLLWEAWQARAALASPAVSQQAAPEAPASKSEFLSSIDRASEIVSTWPKWKRSIYAPAVSQKDGAAVECGMCNDSGIVGFPPDQYEECPDCIKARAATTASASGETNCTDGGKCGIGGYCAKCPYCAPAPSRDAAPLDFDAWWNTPNPITGHPPGATLDHYSARKAWDAAELAGLFARSAALARAPLPRADDVVAWQNRHAPDHIVEGKNPPDASDKWVALVYLAGAPLPAQGDGPQVKVERNRVWIVKGNQSFMLAYVPGEGDDPAEMEAYANNLRAALFTFTPCVNSVAAPAQAGDVRDAARWRAFIDSARIKMWGSAGLETPQPNNYAHFGMEIWTTYGKPGEYDFSKDNEIGVRWLTRYADIAIEAQRGAMSASQGQNGGAA